MIYTRNKQSFKTKNVKMSSITTPNTVKRNQNISQNGFNLIEQLKSRIQNKHVNKSNYSSNQNTNRKEPHQQKNNQTNNHSYQNQLLNNQLNKNKKISISKSSYQQQDTNNIGSSQNNAFRKVKKNQFDQLVSSPQSLPQITPWSKHDYLVKQQNKNYISNSGKQSKNQSSLSSGQLIITQQTFHYFQGNNYINNNDQIIDQQQSYQQSGKIYESPIDMLGRQTQQYEANEVSDYYDNHQLKNNSKGQQLKNNPNNNQNNDKGVKKWKNRQNNQQVENKQQKDNGMNKSCKTSHRISIISNALSINIVSKLQPSPIKNNKSPNNNKSSYQQYIALLQQKNQSLKQQLHQIKYKQQTLSISVQTLTNQNNSFKQQNSTMKLKIQQIEKTIKQYQQSNFVISKYQRLFQKMRNLMMISAMELIEVKNSVLMSMDPAESRINESASHYNNFANQNNKQSSNLPQHSLIKSNYHSIISPYTNEQRIKSINQCIAKIQQTIQVSQKVVQINSKRELVNSCIKQQQINYEVFNSKMVLQNKQLEQSLFYKEKIIKSLKEEIQMLLEEQRKTASFKQTSKLQQGLTINRHKITSSLLNERQQDAKQSRPTSLSRSARTKASGLYHMPYTYVDQISLLRHQINRLTNQNCVLYQKIVQKQERYRKIQAKYPNQSRIKEISQLIDNIGSHRVDDEVNSKVEYWVNGNNIRNKNDAKENHYNEENRTGNSKGKVNQDNRDRSSNKGESNSLNKQQFKPNGKNENRSKRKQNDEIKIGENDRINSKKDMIMLQQPKHYSQVQISSKTTIMQNLQSVKSIQYQREQFHQLVKQFKSSLSGLTPEKLTYNINFHKTTNINHQNDSQPQIIQLPTFRTPNREQKQKQSSFNNNRQVNYFSNHNGSDLHMYQQQAHNFQNQKQAISRLQYEKQFLASQRQALLKQNQQLLKKIQLYQSQIKLPYQSVNTIKQKTQQKQKYQILKQEIYKLKYQNQELVDRVVEAENQLIRQKQKNQTYLSNIMMNQSIPKSQINQLNSNDPIKINSSPQKDINFFQKHLHQKILYKQAEIQKLMKQNIQLHRQVQEVHNNLLQQKAKNKTFYMENNTTQGSLNQKSSLTNMLAPSFQSLLSFLKKLPKNQQVYHNILLKLIEGYEKKVAQLREQNATMRTLNQEIQQFLAKTVVLVQKIDKYMFDPTKSSLMKSSINSSMSSSQIVNEKLSSQTKLLLQKYINLSSKYQSLSNIKDFSVKDLSTKKSSTKQRSKTIQNSKQIQRTSSLLVSKITYHLMVLRSLIVGIGKDQLSLIEEELKDYLKQLKYRIPTVLERQQIQQENNSSCNVSVMREDDFTQQQEYFDNQDEIRQEK